MAKSKKYRQRQEPTPKTPEPELTDTDREIECSLPKKDLFRVEETAMYFRTSDSTIRRWAAHGKLDAEKPGGQMRITRVSIVRLRMSSMLSKRYA